MNLYSSKQNSEYIVNYIKDLLTIPNISNVLMSGMVAMVHLIFTFYTLKIVCFLELKNYKYIYVIILWLAFIYSNYYFHGCLLTRIERALNNDGKWFGPITIFFFLILGLEPSKILLNNAIKYGVAFPFSLILITRLYFAKKYYIAVFLYLILAPLLFIHSQHTLFNNTDMSDIKKFAIVMTLVLVIIMVLGLPFVILFTVFSLVLWSLAPILSGLIRGSTANCLGKHQLDTKLTDKNIIVSGASSGIGLAVTKELLSHNANVICLMRNSDHAKKNYKKLKSIYGNKISWIKVDYTSFTSIKNAIKNINLRYKDGIDILFNNAGIWNKTPYLTEDNYEAQIQTNCISHILLTECLLPQIEQRKGVIINHSSLSYNIPTDSYNSNFFKQHKNLDKFKGIFLSQRLYQQSKLGLLLYTLILQNRLTNKDIRAISFHPGLCKTNLFKPSVFPSFIIKIIDRFFINTSDVVPTLLDCMVSPLFNEKNIIYGPTNISINKDMIHPRELDRFKKDVVSQFII